LIISFIFYNKNKSWKVHAYVKNNVDTKSCQLYKKEEIVIYQKELSLFFSCFSHSLKRLRMQSYKRKFCLWNNKLVLTWCQFHSHFTHAFFVQKCFFRQNVTREKLCEALSYKNACVKCWRVIESFWNWISSIVLTHLRLYLYVCSSKTDLSFNSYNLNWRKSPPNNYGLFLPKYLSAAFRTVRSLKPVSVTL